MGICQIIYLVLICMALGMSLVNHGKPKTGTNNFWISLLSAAIQIGLLYGGGFFS